MQEHADALSQRYPDCLDDFTAVVTEVNKQLDAADSALGAREDLLNLHQTVASHLLDLTSELLWVKDKLVQIRQRYDDWRPGGQRALGSQLLRVQQAKRRLMNHIAEVENRGPRVKALCMVSNRLIHHKHTCNARFLLLQKVKETYIETSEAAGPRLASFREVLGELEQAWYTVTHLLEVRREELRLAQ